MNSTNVQHSDEQNNVYIVGGFVFPKTKENELEIPPTSSGKGPDSLNVRLERGMEIPKQSGIILEGSKVTIYIESNNTIHGDISKLSEEEIKMVIQKYPSLENTIKSAVVATKGEDR